MVNNLSVIIVVLLIFEIMFMVAARSYYYQNVQYLLTSRARVLMRSFQTYQSEQVAGFEDVAREFVGNFADKEKMELQVVDATGHIVVSSTGFQPVEEISPDYSRAFSSDDGIGVWNGRNSTGENVMALSL